MFSLQTQSSLLHVLHQHSLTWLNNRTAGAIKTDKGKTSLKFLAFWLNGLAWVPVFKMLLEFVSPSGRTIILKHNDNHKCSSVSIYSERSKDAAGLWVYSAMYHYRRVSRPVDGWAVLSSPFITLVNSEGIFFFFFLPCERPISNESVKWRRQLICEFRFYKVTLLWWAV